MKIEEVLDYIISYYLELTQLKSLIFFINALNLAVFQELALAKKQRRLRLEVKIN